MQIEPGWPEEKEIKKEYAVYTEEAMVNGIYDNDLMDWFEDYEQAKKFAIKTAKKKGVETMLSVVEDGDFSDKPEIY